MRVVFSDDSGRGDRRDERLTVVTAVMFNMDVQWEPFFAEYDALLVDAMGRVSRHEPKGAKLLKDATEGKTNAKRLLEGILRLPRKHLIPVFYGAVDRAGVKARSEYLSRVRKQMHMATRIDRVDLAFLDCINRVDTYVNTLIPRERILWIADKGGKEQEGKKFELQWRRFYESIREINQKIEREHKRTGRPIADLEKEPWAGIRVTAAGLPTPPKTSHIVETVFFGDSKESLALQLADVCCAAVTAHLNEAPGAEYYELIRSQVVGDGTPPAFTLARPVP